MFAEEERVHPAITSEIAWTGSRYVNVLDPLPVDIDLGEIATGLSREARYGGACTGDVFWTVGQHSLLCLHLAREDGVDQEAALRPILMHDAPEYMLRDMIRPVKRQLPDYATLESRWWQAIAVRFRLPLVLPEFVTHYDNLACGAEKRAFICSAAGPWPGIPEHRDIPGDLLRLSHAETKQRFLEECKLLNIS